MAQPPVVGVVGLKALLKDIDRLTTDERGPLFNAMKRAGYHAVTPVVGRTREALPVTPRRGVEPGRLAMSTRASGTRSGAAVRMGSKTVPYAGWVEFGGQRRRPHLSERPFISSGRYLFPAARDLGPAAARQYTDAINDLFHRNAVWTNATETGESVHD